jgi:TatA/E family protein of Tat protein translocase
MFGLGTWEIMLVVIVAVVFLGPDKLPELAKKVGGTLRSLQDAMSGMDRSIKPVQSAARRFSESMKDAVSGVKDAADLDEDPDAADSQSDDPDTRDSEPAAPNDAHSAGDFLDDERVAAPNPFDPVAPPEAESVSKSDDSHDSDDGHDSDDRDDREPPA